MTGDRRRVIAYLHQDLVNFFHHDGMDFVLILLRSQDAAEPVWQFQKPVPHAPIGLKHGFLDRLSFRQFALPGSQVQFP